MPIAFPDFKNEHLFWITLCGEVPTASRALKKQMNEEKEWLASFETIRGNGYIRLRSGGTSKRHVHIDIFSEQLIAGAGKKRKAIKSVGQSGIQEALSRFLGKEIVLGLRAGFKAKLSELPEAGIIRSFLFTTKMSDVSLKLEGAKFSIAGAPVQSITWNVQRDNEIGITVEAESLKQTISDEYLINSVSLAEKAFNVFVLGKVQNEAN